MWMGSYASRRRILKSKLPASSTPTRRFMPSTPRNTRSRRRSFYTDLNKMLAAVKPDAVASFTSTFDHPAIVEACAAKKIPVMMEKPMAVSMEHARRIQKAVAQTVFP